MKSKKIKIKDCEKISKEYGYEKVIIIGINEIDDCVDEIDMGIATYGNDKNQCKRAKQLGQEVCKNSILNWFWE